MPYCPSCNGRFQEGTFCPKDGTPLLPDGEPPKSLVGQVIGGRYRLTKLLGAGGMGEVYAAEHIRITKKVAVKLLHPEISANQEAFVRFQQEAQSASNIGHDNIVAIDDFGIMDDGRAYLCMEFLQGQSLSEAMQARGGLDPIRALNIMIQVCDGLAAAHAKKIIHRDMKPENVFLTRRSDGSEIAKILDFGIAKVSGTDRNESLTRTGTVFGTPHYMSPEQALGQKLDHRADIYSVGVMLFEIFTGQVPFKAESFMGILSQHITKPAPQPSSMTPGRSVPKPIEDIILRAMQKEADKRFQSMGELRDALKRCLDDAMRSSAGSRGSTMAYGGMAPGPASQPTASEDMAARSQMAMQATMASVSPQQGRAAVPSSRYATVGSTPSQVGSAAAGDAGIAPAATSEVIPKTVLGGQQSMSPQMAAPIPTPVPVVRQPSGGKSHTGLIIGIVAGVVVLGGAATAAILFWDKITGKGPEVTTGSGSAPGTGSGTVAAGSGSGSSAGSGSGSSAGTGTGSGSTVVASAKPDAAPAKVEPSGEEPSGEEPATQEPVAGKKHGKKHGKHGGKKVAATETKDEPKPEPKPEPPTKKKVEPKEECCTVTIASVPSDAAVLQNGRPTGHRTPYTLKLRPGETATFTLAKGGHADQRITVRGRNGTQSFKLKRRIPGEFPGADPGGMPGSDPGIR